MTFTNKFGKYRNVECGLVSIVKPPPPADSSSDSDDSGSDSDDDDYDNNNHNQTQQTVPIPLQSVNILAHVIHAVAQVELTQVYVNRENQPIEAIYYFPMDSNGTVVHFRAELEGRTITGVVKPEEEAKAQYKKAVEQKQTAFLMEADKPDIFKVRVGFLKPGAQVKIVIGYVTEVKNEKGSNAIRFVVPTTVAPRYISPSETDAAAEDLRKMTFSDTSPAPLSLTVNLAIQGEIEYVHSPGRQIKVESLHAGPNKANWSQALVTFTGHTADMDSDFVLLIGPRQHVPRLYSEKVDNSTALMTHLIPSFKLDAQKVELIFVLDRSGSMAGGSIELAKRALSLFLHSLPVDCYFNIVGFGSRFELLFKKSEKYDDESLKKAKAHAKGLRANLGGTEILKPLKEIFSKDLIPGYLRQVFVLTDGEVSDTDRVIGLCREKANVSRVFALGIGNAASHHLVEGMAEAGRGTAIFASNNEAIDAKVLQQLQNALQPSLTNVKIKWLGLSDSAPAPKPVEVNKTKTLMGYGKPVASMSAPKPTVPQGKLYYEVPEKIPPIFDGSQLVIFGIFPNATHVPTGVEIIAESPDGPLSVQMMLSEENNLGATGMLHKLAAIKAIRELELQDSYLSSSRSRSDGTELANLKAQITHIGCTHGLASKYTSFIAVDSQSEAKVDDNWIMETRNVPSQRPNRGYASPSYSTKRRCKSCKSSGPSRAKKSCNSSSSKRRGSSSGGYSGQRSKCRSSSKKMGCKSRSSSAPSPKPKAREVKKGSEDKLHDIVATQFFNGSFPLNQEFASAIGKSLDKLLKEAQNNGWNHKAWATALALIYLTEKLSDQSESFILVESKGRKWLQGNHGSQMEAMYTAARAFLK